ncbi:toxin-antitoxin system YwqK family antitoxin [Tenacibaculum sp. nBUS_03]|uniref:toxin-antitoxin system YwqK family antitoxin n=1 Tax=Tenacibaculum sp. nBUS_03 TaxID=3395320 RepID=UPI003EB6B452
MKSLLLLNVCVLLFLFKSDSSKRKYSDTKFTYEFSITENTSKVKFKREVKLYWYALEKIESTFSGFSGRLLHGKYRKTLIFSKKIIEEGNFLYGMKNGEWKEWDEKGNLICITNWKEGKKDGFYEYYAEENKKIIRGYYLDGEKNSKWTIIDNGNLTKTTWSKNLRNGIYKEYDSLGGVIRKGRYKRGFKTGIWIDYRKKTRKRYSKGKIVNENVETFWDTFKEKKS